MTNLYLSAAWAAGDMLTITVFSIVFVKRPLEEYRLALALDGFALVCGVVACGVSNATLQSIRMGGRINADDERCCSV